jgi:hypothetical protein
MSAPPGVYAPLPPELAQFARTPQQQEQDRRRRGQTNQSPTALDNINVAAREAENQPTQFPAGERGQYLKDMISQMDTYKIAGRTVDEIKVLMADFFEKYPRLFDMVSRPNYDKTQINVMIRMLEKMGTGELSQHQASIIVGQKLTNTYVTPTLRSGHRT